MNTIRMIAIALPMTLLLACGGGGGGGGTAAAPTTPAGDRNVNPLAGLNVFMSVENSSTIQTIQGINRADGTHLLLSDVYEAGNVDFLWVACGIIECTP